MMSDDNGQMIFGDLGGVMLPDICLTGEEKPRKNPPRKPVPTGDRTRARCLTGTHAAAWPTAVDDFAVKATINNQLNKRYRHTAHTFSRLMLNILI